MDDAKPHPDPQAYHEGPKTAENFISTMKEILSVSPEEMKKRHKKWEQGRRKNRTKSHI
jgi:hypothetical protein